MTLSTSSREPGWEGKLPRGQPAGPNLWQDGAEIF